jgi:hypothetical protein
MPGSVKGGKDKTIIRAKYLNICKLGLKGKISGI